MFFCGPAWIKVGTSQDFPWMLSQPQAYGSGSRGTAAEILRGETGEQEPDLRSVVGYGAIVSVFAGYTFPGECFLVDVNGMW